jgi:tetratricopeptide (TPR) repeat protein
MGMQPVSGDEDIYYNTLIQSYVNSPNFISRPWLANRVETAINDPNCRFILLTAEPGAGKTAFAAWLAHQHSEWPRYFIRRDSQTLLSSGDARSFFFAIGHQLASFYPRLFHPELEIEILQHIGVLEASGKAVGISIDDLYVSPFYKTSIHVEQQAQIVRGELAGMSVKRFTAEERFLELGNIEFLALIGPAQALLKENPNSQIVILIDALDELRYYTGRDSVLDWLKASPELPANVRFVLTSRPEKELLDVLRRRQKAWLREEIIDPQSEQVRSDILCCSKNFAAQETIKNALKEHGISSDYFANLAATKAEGNFQFLVALFRVIDQTIKENSRENLDKLLRFEDVPQGLDELYAFFLSLVKNSVTGRDVEVLSDTPFDVKKQSSWEYLYQPILGVLSVAKEPLDFTQIIRLSASNTDERWAREAMLHIDPFLDHIDSNYRLYHSTFSEFLTSPKTQKVYPEYYLEPAESHRKIVGYYRGKAPAWEDVNWHQVDDYGLSHLVEHLYALIKAEATIGRSDRSTIFRKELFGLICKSFMREKELRTYSHRSFASDVDLAIQAAESEEPANLVQIVRGSLIYATLGDMASNVLPEALDVLARLGQTRRALGISALIHDILNQSQAYQFVADALLAQGERDQAKDVLSKALALITRLDDPSKVFPLSDMAQSLVRASDHEGLQRVLAMAKAIDDRFWRAVTLNELVRVLAETGDADTALKIAEDIDDKKFKTYALSSIAQSFVAADNSEKAIEIHHQALFLAESIKDHDKVYAIIGIARDLAVAGDKEEVADIVRKALEATQKIEDVAQRTSALNDIAEILAQMGSFEDAISAVEKNENLIHKTEGQIQIARPMIKAGEEKKAEQILDEAWAAVVKIPAVKEKWDLLRRISDLLVRLGHLERALMAANAIGEDWIRISAIVDIVRALSESGQCDQALSVADTITDKKQKASALCSVAQSLIREGKTDVASALAERILLIAGSTKQELLEKVFAFNKIALAIAQGGEMEKAAKIAAQSQILSEGIKTETERAQVLVDIARTLSGISDKAGSRRLLEQIEVLKDLRCRVVALTGMAQILGGFGDKKEATSLTERALVDAEEIFFDGSKADALVDIVWTFDQIGERQRAFQVASIAWALMEHTIDEDSKARMLSNLARTLAEIGNEDNISPGLEIARSIKSEQHKVLALGGIAQALAILRRKDEAAVVANQAFAVTESIDRCAEKGLELEFALGEASRALSKVGNFEKALVATEQMTFHFEKDLALADIVGALIEAREMNRAQSLTDEIGDEYLRAMVLSRLADAMRKLGDKENMQSILMQAFAFARQKGRFGLFRVLGVTANAIGTFEHGKILWSSYEAVNDVDSWWE